MASLRVDASLAGYRELMRWAKQFPERRWAVPRAPPVRDGFWKDPTGRYAYRLWQGLNWTERVRDDAGREGIDPDFPTDADVKEWDRNNRRP